MSMFHSTILRAFALSAFLAAAAAFPTRGDGTNCRDYEVSCDTTCCNTWRWKCNEYESFNNKKTKEVKQCVPDYGEMSSDRAALVVFVPLILTPTVIILGLLALKHGFTNAGDSGVMGKVTVALGFLCGFLSIFLLYTPLNIGALYITLMGLLSMYSATKEGCWRVLLFAFVVQALTFLQWGNPYGTNGYLSTHEHGYLGDIVLYSYEGVSGRSYNPVSCAQYYRSYFITSHRDEKDDNNAIPRWGYCGRHWLAFNSVMMLIMIASNMGLLFMTFVRLCKSLTN